MMIPKKMLNPEYAAGFNCPFSKPGLAVKKSANASGVTDQAVASWNHER